MAEGIICPTCKRRVRVTRTKRFNSTGRELKIEYHSGRDPKKECPRSGKLIYIRGVR